MLRAASVGEIWDDFEFVMTVVNGCVENHDGDDKCEDLRSSMVSGGGGVSWGFGNFEREGSRAR